MRRAKLYIVWKPFCTRSRNIAKHFNAPIIYISPLYASKAIPVLLMRYVISIWKTILALVKTKPKLILSINQPPFLITTIFFYAKVTGGSYILDSHSGAFNDPKWAWFRFFYRQIAKRALLNINTNTTHRDLVQQWGGRSHIISDVPIDHDMEYPRRNIKTPGIAVIVSFMFDEPLEEIWGAARLCPDIHFYVTGNYKKAPETLLTNRPENLQVTGLLSVTDYFGLLSSADAIMVLTKRDETMQMGGYEALSLDKPLITSDWAILKESFGDGAVYVDNTPAGIAEGVEKIVSKKSHFQDSMKQQRLARRRIFEETKKAIDAEIQQFLEIC